MAELFQKEQNRKGFSLKNQLNLHESNLFVVAFEFYKYAI